MDAARAREVAKQHRLISREDSRLLIRMINGEEEISADRIPAGVSIGEIENLRKRYIGIERDLGGGPFVPRNLPIHLLAREVEPRHDWCARPNPRDPQRVDLVYSPPRVGTLLPSLASLLLGRASRGATDSHYARRLPALSTMPPKLVDAFIELGSAMQARLPDPRSLPGIASWLSRGLSGRRLTLFMPVCPDYAYEVTDSARRPYRYTFDGLGSGPGIVGSCFIRAIPGIADACERLGIRIDFLLGGGDFEGFPLGAQQRLGLSKREFRDRVVSGLESIQRNTSVPVSIAPISSLIGEPCWVQRAGRFRSRLANGDLGSSSLSFGLLKKALRSRASLYERWFGKANWSTSHLSKLLDQGSEYATMGWIAEHRLRNCLIYGADHSAMIPFYHVGSRAPVLYAERLYH